MRGGFGVSKEMGVAGATRQRGRGLRGPGCEEQIQVATRVQGEGLGKEGTTGVWVSLRRGESEGNRGVGTRG